MHLSLGSLVRHPAILASVAYLAVAAGTTWPLPLHLSTHLIGAYTGDLGVYVWNLWIFSHELIEHGRLPFSTDHVFAYTDGTDFAVHNYTPLAGLLGAPLVPRLGIVTTFNLVLLAAIASSGLGVFALARRTGLDAGYSWLAGALFMASPAMMSRETAHISLVSAATLPLFAAMLLRTFETPRPLYGAALGGLVAAAMYSDAYYGVYCVLIGAFLVTWRFVRVAPSGRVPSRGLKAAVDGLLVAIALLVTWRVVTGTTVLVLGPLRIGVDTLYNPMMGLTLLGAFRLWLTRPVRFSVADPARELPRLLTIGGLGVGVALVLLAPLLVGLTLRYMNGQLPETATFWRSTPRGVDLFAYLVPNPTHPWLGRFTANWLLPPAGDAYPEYVAAFPLFAWLAIAVAIARRELPVMWVAFTAWFMALSLGPFIHIAGVNTAIVGPWAFLRYIPVIGLARTPTRFTMVAAVGLSILAAFAVRGVVEARPRRVRLLLTGVVLCLAEMLPVSRPLHAATVPLVYSMLATPCDNMGRLLDLPTGLRDGTSSIGDFNASSQFFQTMHERPLIGGYLSRVPEGPKREVRRAPILRALLQLSERGAPIDPAWLEEARASRERFLARSCVRYVVVDRHRATAALRDFAVDVLKLVPIHQDANHELLVPIDPPSCEPRRKRSRGGRRDVGPSG